MCRLRNSPHLAESLGARATVNTARAQTSSSHGLGIGEAADYCSAQRKLFTPSRTVHTLFSPPHEGGRVRFSLSFFCKHSESSTFSSVQIVINIAIIIAEKKKKMEHIFLIAFVDFPASKSNKHTSTHLRASTTSSC